MAKAWKITISGYYKTNGTDNIVDYDGISGVIPLCGEAEAKMHTSGRYAPKWLREKKNDLNEREFTKRVNSIPTCFIDGMEIVEVAKFSYEGKDIKAMEVDEIQDFATYYDLRTVPLDRVLSGASLRTLREKAYEAYVIKTTGKPSEPNSKDENNIAIFDYAKLPPLFAPIVSVAAVEAPREIEVSSEVTSQKDAIVPSSVEKTTRESNTKDAEKRALQKLLTAKGVAYHHMHGVEKLHELLKQNKGE